MCSGCSLVSTSLVMSTLWGRKLKPHPGTFLKVGLSSVPFAHFMLALAHSSGQGSSVAVSALCLGLGVLSTRALLFHIPDDYVCGRKGCGSWSRVRGSRRNFVQEAMLWDYVVFRL